MVYRTSSYYPPRLTPTPIDAELHQLSTALLLVLFKWMPTTWFNPSWTGRDEVYLSIGVWTAIIRIVAVITLFVQSNITYGTANVYRQGYYMIMVNSWTLCMLRHLLRHWNSFFICAVSQIETQTRSSKYIIPIPCNNDRTKHNTRSGDCSHQWWYLLYLRSDKINNGKSGYLAKIGQHHNAINATCNIWHVALVYTPSNEDCNKTLVDMIHRKNFETKTEYLTNQRKMDAKDCGIVCKVFHMIGQLLID